MNFDLVGLLWFVIGGQMLLHGVFIVAIVLLMRGRSVPSVPREATRETVAQAQARRVGGRMFQEPIGIKE
jgi:hypothetical protein